MILLKDRFKRLDPLTMGDDLSDKGVFDNVSALTTASPPMLIVSLGQGMFCFSFTMLT